VVNRLVSRIDDRNGVHLTGADGDGVAWVEGTDFSAGTIEVDIRGRDVMQGSFVGIAFHRHDDNTYETVYLRPFNFRTTDPTRKQHAVQYQKTPELDWSALREKSPEEFENPVAGSIEPTGWVKVRVVVEGIRVQIYVGAVQEPTLDVRKLGRLFAGQVGLWVGNTSEGDFANLVITPAN
jgi:hypothetical protein